MRVNCLLQPFWRRICVKFIKITFAIKWWFGDLWKMGHFFEIRSDSRYFLWAIRDFTETATLTFCEFERRQRDFSKMHFARGMIGMPPTPLWRPSLNNNNTVFGQNKRLGKELRLWKKEWCVGGNERCYRKRSLSLVHPVLTFSSAVFAARCNIRWRVGNVT